MVSLGSWFSFAKPTYTEENPLLKKTWKLLNDWSGPRLFGAEASHQKMGYQKLKHFGLQNLWVGCGRRYCDCDVFERFQMNQIVRLFSVVRTVRIHPDDLASIEVLDRNLLDEKVFEWSQSGALLGWSVLQWLQDFALKGPDVNAFILDFVCSLWVLRTKTTES